MDDPLVGFGLACLGLIPPALAVCAVAGFRNLSGWRAARRRRAAVVSVDTASLDAMQVAGALAARAVKLSPFGRRGRSKRSQAIAAANAVLLEVDGI